MIDSISIAETGLRGFEQGLRTISNNTANLNTPGFKSATLQFADISYGGNGQSGSAGAGLGAPGHGLKALGTTLSFTPGQRQSTGNDLDVAIDGEGFFTLESEQGALHYTKNGQFKFDTGGTLVSIATGEKVMLADAAGVLQAITLGGLQTLAARPTGTVRLGGNLSSSAASGIVGNITVIDGSGSSHTLSLALAPVAGATGTWTATLSEGSTTVGGATLVFANGTIAPESSRLAFEYTPAGGVAQTLSFDLSNGVTSFDTGTTSTLAVAGQDGFGVGTLTKQSFDSQGTLILAYSNGQTVEKGRLALAQFASPDDVEAIGNNAFVARNGASWQTGIAGSGRFGSVQSGVVETSNVDLSQEFSNLVIMQRGYQACSQVISTASEMLTSLFGMMSK